MRITEKDIMAALAGGDDEPTFEETLEKVANAAQEVEEVLNDEYETSLAELDDDEALEVLADYGLSIDEIAEVLEALGEIDDDDDEGVDKEAAAEMYEMGYAYGAGFNDALEKQAGEVSDLKVKLKGAKQRKALDKYRDRLDKSGQTKRKVLAALRKYKRFGMKHKGKIGVGAGLLGLAGVTGVAAGRRSK